MRIKLQHRVVSWFLLVLLTCGTVGLNVVHYCCNSCEEGGISGVLDEMCGTKHADVEEMDSCCSGKSTSNSPKPTSNSSEEFLASVEADSQCSISHLQLTVENILNDFSQSVVLSYTLLPVESLFSTFEKEYVQPQHLYTLFYRGRDILVQKSVLLI